MAGDTMTEPLDIDAIETEARAYVEAYDQSPPVNMSFKYLVDVLAAVRERDAEIARLREVFDRTCKQHAEAMRGTCNTYQAEIARLREVERRHLGWCDACQVYHRTGNCPVTDEPPSKEARESWCALGAPLGPHKAGDKYFMTVNGGEPREMTILGPPSADVLERASEAVDSWESGDGFTMAEHVARTLQQYGDEREAAAQPIVGADAAQRASRLWYTEIDGKPQSPGWIIQAYAREMQAYGDERAAAARVEWPPNTAEPTDPATGTQLDLEPALWLRDCWVYTQDSALDAIRAARAAAIKEALGIVFDVRDRPGRSLDWCNACTEIQTSIRALAAKPGSET